MTRLSILIFAALLVSCNTTGPSQNVQFQTGTYEGNFFLTNYAGTDSAQTQQSQATFVFSDSGTYTCKGGLFLFGAGSYEVAEDTLVLRDTLMRVAILDWTQVLDGAFYFFTDGSKLTMMQDDPRMNRYRVIELKLQ